MHRAGRSFLLAAGELDRQSHRLVREHRSRALLRHREGRRCKPVVLGSRTVGRSPHQRLCAITGESTLPVLEAAHIRPFAKSGVNEVSNGMLLRSDFHKLFDAGFVTVTPALRVEVSAQIKEQWFNGKPYYRLHGKTLSNVPRDPVNRPSDEFLSWHNENCFVG